MSWESLYRDPQLPLFCAFPGSFSSESELPACLAEFDCTQSSPCHAPWAALTFPPPAPSSRAPCQGHLGNQTVVAFQGRSGVKYTKTREYSRKASYCTKIWRPGLEEMVAREQPGEPGFNSRNLEITAPMAHVLIMLAINPFFPCKKLKQSSHPIIMVSPLGAWCPGAFHTPGSACSILTALRGCVQTGITSKHE